METLQTGRWRGSGKTLKNTLDDGLFVGRLPLWRAFVQDSEIVRSFRVTLLVRAGESVERGNDAAKDVASIGVELPMDSAASNLEQPGDGTPAVTKRDVAPRFPLWARRLLEFVFFLALFAVYDCVAWRGGARYPGGTSLINYVVRDGRTDESAMYWPLVREIVEGHFGSADPYLVEYKHSPDVKPRIPTWLCAAVLWCAGTTNLSVVIIHSLFPAIAAMLLVEISVPFVGRRWALAVTLLSAMGITFAFNDIAVALRLVELQGPAKYMLFEHVFRSSGLHMDFQRYFSPGLTLFPFLLGVWLLVRDPDLRRWRTLPLTGLLVGLHTEIYPHGGVILFVFAAALIGLNWKAGVAGRDSRSAARQSVAQLLVLGATATVVAIPWLLRYRSFRKLEQAHEIVHRIGNFDFFVDAYRLPVLTWLVIAICLWRGAARAPRMEGTAVPSNQLDRLWMALVMTFIVTGWWLGMAGHWGLFPSPHLINYRYLCYLAPLLVAYPFRLRLQDFWDHTGQQWKWTIQRLGQAAMLLLLTGIVYGEYRAARNCKHLYVITPGMARVRDLVIPATPAESVILTDDLRLTSYLVCETDRHSYIGYASVSLAPTSELIDRLMIPSIIAGRSFEEFESRHYYAGFGVPNGPNGMHWVLHHGGDLAPVPRPKLVEQFDRLQKLPAEALIHRYHFDYAFYPAASPAPRFTEYLRPTKVPGLYQKQLAAATTEQGT